MHMYAVRVEKAEGRKMMGKKEDAHGSGGVIQ